MDDYREWATHCHRMAAKAPSDALRSGWLQLAAMWLQMATDQEWRSLEEKLHPLTLTKASRPGSSLPH